MRTLGVDVARGAWIAVAFEDGRFAEASVEHTFAAVLARYPDAAVVGVDVPIGLPKIGARRRADVDARAMVGARWSSVFWTPPLAALDQPTRIAPSYVSTDTKAAATFHIRSNRHVVVPLVVGLLFLCAWAPPGVAASPSQPSIRLEAPGNGPIRTLEIRLSNANDGAPIDGARVTAAATMTVPDVMSIPPWRLHPRGEGRYSAHVLFWMLARWTVTVRVARRGVAPATSRFEVDTHPPPARAEASKSGIRTSKSAIGAGPVAAGAAGVAVIALALVLLARRNKAARGRARGNG